MQSSPAKNNSYVAPVAKVGVSPSPAPQSRQITPRADGQDPSPSPASAAAPSIRLIPLQSVCNILGLKRSAVLDKVAKGEIPLPIKFGTNRRAAVRWIEQEIVDYVWAKAAQRTRHAETRHDAKTTVTTE